MRKQLLECVPTGDAIALLKLRYLAPAAQLRRLKDRVHHLALPVTRRTSYTPRARR